MQRLGRVGPGQFYKIRVISGRVFNILCIKQKYTSVPTVFAKQMKIFMQVSSITEHFTKI